jgi:hypothetical protein
VKGIKSGEYIATGIGPSRELDKEGGKQVGEFLFIDVPEVKIKICQGGHPSVA